MLYNNLKRIIKKIPLLWKSLTWFKDRLIILSRLKDVTMMMIMLHVWPEQTYRFSTRKLLPCKKNRFPKETKPIIPFDLLKTKSSDMPRMKEINVIGRGSSFDLNDIKKIKGPIFLVSFWNSLKMNNNGKIFYDHYFSYKSGKFVGEKSKLSSEDLKEYLSDKKDNKDYKKEDMIYVNSREKAIEQFKKKGHNILSIETHKIDKNGNYLTVSPMPTKSYFNLIDNDQCKRISLVEKIYLPPLQKPYPDWAPTGSFLPSICALSFFAEKINVYGWDTHLNSSPGNMGHLQLLFNMNKYKADVFRWNAHFEHALINFYYGYQFSKLPNINIHGYMGQLGKHEKLIKRIERVLFQ